MAGRRMADYVELLPVDARSTGSSGPTATRFDYTGDARGRWRSRSARRNPDDVAGYRAFVEYARKVFVKGYEELGATPFLRFADMVRVAPDLAAAARRPHGLRGGVLASSRTSTCGRRCPSIRCSWAATPSRRAPSTPSSTTSSGSGASSSPAAARGRWCEALVRLFEELGGELRLYAPRAVASTPPNGNGRARHRVAHRRGAARTSTSWSATPTCTTPTPASTASDPRGGAMARRLERMDWSMSLFLVYFGTDRRYPGPGPPHGRLRAALRRPAARRLPRRRAARGLQPVPPRPHGHRSFAGPAGRRGLLRALAGAAPRPRRDRLGEGGPRLRRPHPRRARERLLPDLRAARRHAPHLHARRDFEGELNTYPGLGLLGGPEAHAERLVPPPQPRPAASRASTSWARAPTPGPACPASSTRPRPR